MGLAELAMVDGAGASFALLGSASPLGFSLAVLVLGGGLAVEAVVSTVPLVALGALFDGAELTLDSAFGGVDGLVLATFMPLLEGAGREAGSRSAGIELGALATLFEGAFVALLVLLARGGVLAAVRLGGSSMAALWTGALSGTVATVAVLCPAPLPLAAVAGGRVLESLAIGAAVFSGASMVRSSTSAPPITVAVITPRARPK